MESNFFCNFLQLLVSIVCANQKVAFSLSESFIQNILSEKDVKREIVIGYKNPSSFLSKL